MAHFETTGLEDFAAEMVTQGIDVVRVGYSDLIGTERGRDVLVNRFARTVGDGVAFCRSVYGDHTDGRRGRHRGRPRSRAARCARVSRRQHAAGRCHGSRASRTSSPMSTTRTARRRRKALGWCSSG